MVASGCLDPRKDEVREEAMGGRGNGGSGGWPEMAGAAQVGAMGGERVTGRDHEARAGTRRASGARSRSLPGRHPLLPRFPNMSSLPRSLAAAFLHDQRSARPSSAPPDPERTIPFRAIADDLRTGTITPPHRPCSESPGRPDMGIPASGAPIDLMPQLQRSESSVVKTRSGSVLSRGFILKTDYWPSGM